MSRAGSYKGCLPSGLSPSHVGISQGQGGLVCVGEWEGKGAA